MVDTLHPPFEVIFSWPRPNYVNPQTQGDALYYVCIVLSAVGILIVSARLYSRLFITRAPGVDDALIVVALGFGIALSVLVIIGNKVWLSGHHIWDIPISKFAGHRLNIWNAEWCYVISTSATKISVLLFYRRISIKFSRTFVIATWVGIIYNVLYMISFCLVLLLLCTPINAYWDSFDPAWVEAHPGHHCGKENLELPLSGVFSVIGDFYTALLPMLAIFSLELPTKQKFSLYALFSLAFLIVAAGTARTVLMYQLMNKDYDFTWVLWEMWIWGLVELYVAILAASAPALKPFLRKFLVEPLRTAAFMASSRRGFAGAVEPRRSFHNSGHNRRSRRSYRTNQSSKRDPLSTMKSYTSVRESALIDDPENIGVAYGGADSFTSREEGFVREIEGDELQTRRYELQHSKEGKIVVMQVWHQRPKTGRSVSNQSIRLSHVPVNRPISMPAPAMASSRGTYVLPPFPFQDREGGEFEGYVRNFSLPSPYTAPSTPTSESGHRHSWRVPQPWLSGNRAAKNFQAQQLRTF